jgi:hypothetical protein
LRSPSSAQKYMAKFLKQIRAKVDNVHPKMQNQKDKKG